MGEDQALGARRLGDPGDRPEVLRVLDTVERDQRARTRALRTGGDQLLEPELGQGTGLELDAGRSEPVGVAVGQLADPDPDLPRSVGELDQAGMGRAGAQVEPPQLAPPRRERLADRVQPGQPLRPAVALRRAARSPG